jgi:FixJ family two-component response regulator
MCSVGYEAESFSSAEAFLGSCNLLKWDCIIVDVHMPGMGGLSLVRELHKRGVVTPIILVTASPERSLDDEAKLAGAQRLLRKPFEVNYLLECVTRSFE